MTMRTSRLPELAREHLAQRCEAHRAEQPPEALPRAVEVHRVPEPRQRRRTRHRRRLRIELPRMQVEHGGLSLAIHAAERRARHPEREEPEVSAPAHGPDASAETHGA